MSICFRAWIKHGLIDPLRIFTQVIFFPSPSSPAKSSVFKNRLPLIAVGPLVLGTALVFSGCRTPGGTTAEVTHLQGPSVAEAQMAAYYGPMATIAVGDFQVKAARATREIGDGLREMLVTAMFNSNRFIVLDRQAMQDILLEQDLAASGRVKAGSGPARGQIEAAELYVYGVVSEFEMDEGGTQLGIGVAKLPLMLGGGTSNAHMAIDMRVVDTTTSRILFAARVEGEASDWNVSAAARLGSRGGAVPISLASFENTPMEEAIRVTIDKAVETLTARTPKRYFHHPR